MKFQVANMRVSIWSTNEIPSSLHEPFDYGQQMKFQVPNMSVLIMVNK